MGTVGTIYILRIGVGGGACDCSGTSQRSTGTRVLWMTCSNKCPSRECIALSNTIYNRSWCVLGNIYHGVQISYLIVIECGVLKPITYFKNIKRFILFLE